jgi:dTDP-6-deoxy-L-talose 4-dehydrogenase (NAD+)
MKIAIIGGSGFIGLNLINKLKKKKQIHIIATFNKNRKLKNQKNIIWKQLNLERNRTNFFKYLQNPDIVINAAWKDLPNYESFSNYKTLKFQKRFLKNLVENGLQNLIILGTCFEYGLKEGQLSENLKPKPVTAYGKCKVKLYEYLKQLKRKKNFKLTWFRLFYIYGFNPHRMTLFNLIQKYKNNKLKSLKITGNLERDYLSIEKVSKIIIKLALLKKNIGLVNLCSGKSIRLKDLTKKLLNSKSKFLKLNFNSQLNKKYESKKFWGSNKKLNKVIKLNNATFS